MSGTAGEASDDDPSRSIWRTITLVVVAALGVFVLVALILTLGDANRQRDRALKLQTHSYEVMILSANLSGTIARAEASLGRYVISADTNLGQTYSANWQLAGQQLGRLDRITRDNREQQALIIPLRRAFDARGAELSTIALNTFYKRNGQAIPLYYKARQSASLTEIDDLLDKIGTQERSLLADRTGDAMRSVARSSGLASTLSVLGILLLVGAVALGWLTVTALGQRAVARAEADAERDRAIELEAAVERASAVLLAQESKLRQVQKMEAVGQLTGGIAHDFNNMLAVVLGGLELAKRQLGADSSAAHRHIDNATEGANRAAALTRQLLAFSREEALRTEPIEPVALVLGMSDLLDRTLGDGVSVAVDAAQDAAWLVRSDRHQLENAVLNLAVNARDAMNGRGTLTITAAGVTLTEGAVGTCHAGDYVALRVADTGCGMSADLLERVFEPFFTTKPAGKGTGLGLSQVFAFVRQADGQVGLESVVGEGTTVTIYLPRYHAEAAGTPRPEAKADAPVEQPALDILVVEDDPRVLAATMGALAELGHRPIACDDPLAAPAMLAQAGHVDLLVSDVLMPGQTGPEMVAALLPGHPELAILFVTGYAGEAGGEAEFGGHHVLRKPFTLIALERAVAAAIAARAATMLDRIAAE
ncbi:ATP-binding protein [Sphingomonas glacialis]|uniref:histidine kinase n=1 Tax=Sphingomonas glacialis TaxID=658225 RepID=A0A502FZM0_9SPHN|nr:ATP-binding protein [Sphingomonas glacialis]TPG54964.1 response regulator [Sphingomonas glacialis]